MGKVILPQGTTLLEDEPTTTKADIANGIKLPSGAVLITEKKNLGGNGSTNGLNQSSQLPSQSVLPSETNNDNADHPLLDLNKEIQGIRANQIAANTPDQQPAIGGDIMTGAMGTPDERNTGIFSPQKKAQLELDNSLEGLSNIWGQKKEDIQQVLNDSPDEFDATTLQKNVDLYKTNKQAYDRLVPARNIQLAIAKKAGIAAANEFNNLQTDESSNLQHLVENTQVQQQLINKYFEGNERAKYQQLLEQNKSALINGYNHDIQKEWSESPYKDQIDATQYAGLKTLQLFHPDKYKAYINYLDKGTPKAEYELTGGLIPTQHGLETVTPHETETENSINARKGFEAVQKDLADIGRENTARFAKENINNLTTQYDAQSADANKLKDKIDSYEEKSKTTQLSPTELSDYNDLIEKYNAHIPALNNAQAQFNKYNSVLTDVQNDIAKDDQKYPLLAQLKFENQVKDITQKSNMNPAEMALYHYGKGLNDFGEGLENMATNVFGSNNANAKLQLQRLGESKQQQSDLYLPNALTKEEQPFIPKISSDLKNQVKSIQDNEYLTESEKNKKIADLARNNQDQIDYVTNPNAGQSKNFFSMATVYGNAGALGDLAAFATTQAGASLLGGSKLVTAMMPMYIQTQNDFYKEAIEKGISDPSTYANTHATVMALAGMINPDINIVKRALGQKAEQMLAGISESTWNDIVEKNNPVINRIKNSTSSTLKEAAKMGLVYGAGTSIANDVVNKNLFNEPISNEQIIDNAIKATKDMTLNNIALFGVGAVSNFKTISPEEKARLWYAGENPDITNAQIREEVINGNLSKEQAAKRIEAVNNISGLIDQVPTINKKGQLLTDKQKTNYLYNSFIKSKAKNLKATVPEPQQEELNQSAVTADHANNLIIDPKNNTELLRRKAQLEKMLEPKPDTVDGKASNQLSDKEKIDAKGELQAINDKLKEISSSKTETNGNETNEAETKTEANAQASEIPRQGQGQDVNQQEGTGNKSAPSIESAVIEIGGKTYEGKNHAEAILKAKEDGQDISNVDRKGEGKFKLSDGTIINREQAKERFGADRAEQLIPQDEVAKKADKDYEKGKNEGVSTVSSIEDEKNVVKPSDEQQLKDVMVGNTVTFTYKSESEVPDVFKDKISSSGETNGEKFVRVTVAKSLADYELSKHENETKAQTKEPIKQAMKVVYDFEKRKGDIEKRRNEELSVVDKVKNAKNKEELIKAAKEWMDIDPYSKEDGSLSVRSALVTPGGFERGKQLLIEQFEKANEERVKSINKQYDAELKALENETKEAQKPNIKAMEGSDQSNEPISTEKTSDTEGKISETASTAGKEQEISEHPEIKSLEQERDTKIKEISKPDLKLELISSKDLVKAKDPIAAKEQHDILKEKYKALRKLADCI